MINPLLLANVMTFLQSHPGILKLMTKLPKLHPETGALLVSFLERATRDEDPEKFLHDAIKAALDPAVQRDKHVKVTVVQTKEIK